MRTRSPKQLSAVGNVKTTINWLETIRNLIDLAGTKLKSIVFGTTRKLDPNDVRWFTLHSQLLAVKLTTCKTVRVTKCKKNIAGNTMKLDPNVAQILNYFHFIFKNETLSRCVIFPQNFISTFMIVYQKKSIRQFNFTPIKNGLVSVKGKQMPADAP